MMNLRHTLPFGLMAALLSLTGCARLGIGNGSTDYKAVQPIAPLTVPADLTMRPQRPLYPAPVIDPRALEAAPQLTNAKGNRYELPRAQAISPAAQQTVQFAVARPVLVRDGNGNPLLKIDGNAAEAWKYVLAAASTANLSGTDSKTAPYQLDLKRDQQDYRVRLTSTGSSNTLGVYDSKNNYANPELASDILNSIAQNWAN